MGTLDSKINHASHRSIKLYAFLLTIFLLVSACATTDAASPPADPPADPQFEVIATGLLRPIGLAHLPDGSLLVAEAGSGNQDDSGGVSLIKPDGQRGRLVSGLFSSRDAGDIAGVNLVGVAPQGDTIYVGNFGQGHLWTIPLTGEQQTNGLDLPAAPFRPDTLTPAMRPLNRVNLVNPFDITFDSDDAPVVSDASENGVAKETPEGTTRFIHRFEALPDTARPDTTASIEAVPTGITRVGGEYYVTLLGGCPYPEQSGRLVAIDEHRKQRTVVDQLNLPIDVAQGPDGTIWVLEFATFDPEASCFSGDGYRPNSGRLSRLEPDGRLTPVLDGLNFPGAVLPVATNTVYLSEVFDGRVVRVELP